MEHFSTCPSAQSTFFDSNPEYATLVFAAQDARTALCMALSGKLDALLAHEGGIEYERYGRPSNEEMLASYLFSLQRVWTYEEEHREEAQRCQALFGIETCVEA